MPSQSPDIPELGLRRVHFPWCCRYKEKGVMYCHDGHACKCDCHGREAPPAAPQ